MKLLLVFICTALPFGHAFAQAVSISDTGGTPDQSAMLDIQSTEKGMLVPRMTTAQRTMIASPATGLLVFDTGTNGFWFFDGSDWVSLSTPRLLSDTDGDTQIMVEKNSNENMIRFDVAGTEAMQVTSGGSVGIGLNGPSERLHVQGNIKASGTLASGTTLTVNGVLHRITSSDNLDLHISTGRALRLEAVGTTTNVIGGHSGNSVLAPFPGGTIAGGGDVGFPNEVQFSFGTIGGGIGNSITGHSSTIAGGRFNVAGADQSTVGGGQNNTAARYGTVGGGSGNTAHNVVLGGATVSGGINNNASGGSAAIGGGEGNTANDHYSMVPGGHLNQAGGQFSFAAGRRAKVRTATEVGGGDLDGDQGTFIWADATDANFTSSGPNQFLIRANGGLGLNRNNPSHPIHVGTNTSNGNGAHLTTGGVWTNGSDRNSKHHIRQIDSRAILEQLMTLPVTKWQYLGDPAKSWHIGPMAQDFYATFGLGATDTHIGTIDADGVALAAIQGMYTLLQESFDEIRTLKEEVARLSLMAEKEGN